MTQGEIILNYLKDANAWVAEYSLTKRQTRWGWLGISADRAARKLAEQGKVERKMIGKYCYIRLNQGAE